MTQISDNFILEGYVEQRKELDRLLMSNPEMEKKVQKLIRKVLATAKNDFVKAIKVELKSDPRAAYKAVRSMVYKRILGGNVNILNKKRATGGWSDYKPTRTLRSGQRGGNRRTRSARTAKLESYYGSDRSFILRFINSGTNERVINFLPDGKRERVHRGAQGGNLRKYGKTINTGRRGRLKAINFFGKNSQQIMMGAAEGLAFMIDELIQKELR